VKYAEILAENRRLAGQSAGPPYRVVVLGNIVTEQLHEILEYVLRREGVNATVRAGEYDNLVQQSAARDDAECVVLFWEACNLVDGLPGAIQTMSAEEIDALVAQVTAQIDLVLSNLATVPLVIMNGFAALAFDDTGLEVGPFARLCDRLNAHLHAQRAVNLVRVDLGRVLARVSLGAALDWRHYYAAKAPYTPAFYLAYAELIRPAILGALGRVKKVLVFDCDNTLWQGILGEDGPDGIALGVHDPAGAPYAEVQALALGLRKQGVLLALCSKNNPEDVASVLAGHPDMQIRPTDLAAIKVNWGDKAENLAALARELNLGLDSLVFVDDSDFETNLVRERLPGVTVLQVPARRSEYPRLLRDNVWRFHSPALSAEDRRRTEMYREEAQRDAARVQFASTADYLRSLRLRVFVSVDDQAQIPRLAQLTQRTNQFNLTTRRYTEADIARFIAGAASDVLSIRVTDKFGDYGITGLCILTYAAPLTAELDSLLLSCRVLGRGIEQAFCDAIVRRARQRGAARLTGVFRATAKNAQTRDFYDRMGFECRAASDDERHYALDLSGYEPRRLDYVEVVEDGG
jgi:FkbH-like protein